MIVSKRNRMLYKVKKVEQDHKIKTEGGQTSSLRCRTHILSLKYQEKA